MATSVNAASMTMEECIRTVHEISRTALAHDPDPSSLLSNLLQLLPCLEAPHLTTADLSTLRHKIWKNDLIHLVIEVLRDDTSNQNIRDRWRKLTGLAVILSSTLAGLSPKDSKPRKQPSTESSSYSEHIREYYEIILPTATDSILILASNILEFLESNQDNSSPGLLECFKKVVDSLVRLCTDHRPCTHRALQSPYLLNILITDHYLYGHSMLIAMETMMLADESAAACIPHDVLSSIVDELVYKLSGTDGEGATLSLRLLAQLSTALPDLPATLSSGYTGLLTLVKKWTHKDRELGAAVKWLVSKLELEAGEQVGLDEKQKAALFIQASWRGYASRKKMIAAKRGIRKFQLLFRKRRAEKLKRKESMEQNAVKASLKLSDLKRKSSQLDFHQKQLTLYEQQPASELRGFIDAQENKAAIKIQSVWRAHAVRTQIKEHKSKRRSVKSAVIIQRAFRRHIQRKQREKLSMKYEYLPELPEAMRDKLQEEVARYRDTHTTSSAHRTREEAVALHQEVQQEYEKSRFSQSAHAQSIDETRLLISKLNRSCELMLNAPSLDKAFSMDGIEDTFSSKSPLVAKMGRTAHREELKAMNTPWWKRTPLDHQEVTL